MSGRLDGRLAPISPRNIRRNTKVRAFIFCRVLSSNFVTRRGDVFLACGSIIIIVNTISDPNRRFSVASTKTQNISQCRNSIFAAQIFSCAQRSSAKLLSRPSGSASIPIRKKLTALSVNSLCDVVWRAVAETIRRSGRVSLPTQLVLKLITKQETPE
jgi:hypothetical protein